MFIANGKVYVLPPTTDINRKHILPSSSCNCADTAGGAPTIFMSNLYLQMECQFNILCQSYLNGRKLWKEQTLPPVHAFYSGKVDRIALEYTLLLDIHNDLRE